MSDKKKTKKKNTINKIVKTDIGGDDIQKGNDIGNQTMDAGKL